MVIIIVASMMVVASVAASQTIFSELFIDNNGSYCTMTYDGTGERTYNHYEVVEFWSNGNVKTVLNWKVDSQGNRIGVIYEVPYPETGNGAMGAHGTPGGFHGCHCPYCGGSV